MLDEKTIKDRMTVLDEDIKKEEEATSVALS